LATAVARLASSASRFRCVSKSAFESRELPPPQPATRATASMARTAARIGGRTVHSNGRGAAPGAAEITPVEPDPARTGEGRHVTERTPSWGIEPAPERLRTFGALDNTMLWGSLGLSLLVLVAGTVLIPALSLRSALLAILVGGVFGNALLGLAALLGAEGRVPAMVLLRAPLGR